MAKPVLSILITGSKGFVGRNLCAALSTPVSFEPQIIHYDKDTDPAVLKPHLQTADVVVHLAGENRPHDVADFYRVNQGLTQSIADQLKQRQRPALVLLASSIHAAQTDQPYGDSKRAGEESLFTLERQTAHRVMVFRLANLFGKFCRPHYNSVVATFCHLICQDQPLTIHDPTVEVPFLYIDDLLQTWLSIFAKVAAGGLDAVMSGPAHPGLTEEKIGDRTYYGILPIHRVTIGELADRLQFFRRMRQTLQVPQLDDPFDKKLYSTYLSYLRSDDFAYDLKMNVDDRGSFTEFLRTPERGQVSINVAKPGIVKGKHWHHTKTEKFLVVKGRARIQFRAIDGKEIITYEVSGERLQVVDIPVGYTHHIENIGQDDLITVMWANEAFDPDHPDTFFMPVVEEV